MIAPVKGQEKLPQANKTSFAYLLLELDQNTDYDDCNSRRWDREEQLPGAIKTQYAMKFKLDTDGYLMKANDVS